MKYYLLYKTILNIETRARDKAHVVTYYCEETKEYIVVSECEEEEYTLLYNYDYATKKTFRSRISAYRYAKQLACADIQAARARNG